MELVLHMFRLAACTKTGILTTSIYDGLHCTGDGELAITSVSDAFKVVANICQILLELAGGIAILVIIVGAIYYITSAGEPGRIKKAKDIIINTVVGLLVIITAYAVVTFIAKGF